MLVRVEWSAINFKDAMVTRPGNRVARGFPLVPGVELAGSVEESDEPRFHPGPARARAGLRPRRGTARRLRRLRPGPRRVGRAAARPAQLPQRRHHRPGRVHGPALAAPARPARHHPRRRADPGHRGLGWRRAARRWRCWPTRASRWWPRRARRRSTSTCRASGRRGWSGASSPRTTAGPSGPSCGRASSTASAAWRWPRRSAPSATEGPWRRAGSPAATTWPRRSTRSSSAASRCSGSTPWRRRSRSGATLWSDMADAFPLDRCEQMVNEEIGLDGLTAALDRVLDAAVRGRVLVQPSR